jgi:hypothetical protein
VHILTSFLTIRHVRPRLHLKQRPHVIFVPGSLPFYSTRQHPERDTRLCPRRSPHALPAQRSALLLRSCPRSPAQSHLAPLQAHAHSAIQVDHKYLSGSLIYQSGSVSVPVTSTICRIAPPTHPR